MAPSRGLPVDPAPPPTRAARVVAHRGASGYLPEHTLAAYELGIRLGADAFEIDVVPTADGHLIARHENELSGSTDVAQRRRFADRRTTTVIDGVTHTGWFAEDFTLAEVRELRARQPLPGLRGTEHDGRYDVPALPEILSLRARLAEEMDREVGLALEVKSPVHFAAIGHAVEERLIADLEAAGGSGPDSPVEIMSFDLAHLRDLRRRGIKNRMVFLVEEDSERVVPGEDGATYGELTTPAGLARVRDLAEAVGPGRHALFTGMPGARLGAPRRLFADARAAGLRLDCWTFRAENAFLPADFRLGDDPATLGDLAGLVTAYVEHGLDTVITDHSDRVFTATLAVE
ncbi:glycerophosphodiester phosphodiesterase family protein [Nostocoides veronense]|uniref:glycerophosphodiester phosphodiesterase n=1 Tax=Nostocoides veronense TaxID=330836 RepID=A0ABP4XFB7_9MICO